MKKLGILEKLIIFTVGMTLFTFSLIFIIVTISFNNYNDFVFKKADTLLLDRYRHELKSATEIAASTLSCIYKQPDINKNEKLARARRLLRRLRFGKDGYYFVYEKGTGRNIIHGANKKFEGKNLWKMRDPKNQQFIIQELDRAARKKTLFHQYPWPKPGTGEICPKLGTAMLVPGTNLWVGTGAYIDDINIEKNKLNSAIKKIIFRTRITFIISFIIIGILSVAIIIIMSRNLINPIRNMIVSSKEISRGNYDIVIIARTRDEIGQLAENFNVMAHKLKDYTENLEQKVEDRTHELQETMTMLNESNAILEGLSDKLSRYLSPQIRESIFSGKQEGKIESHRKKLTVFFSDIRNFTATTDRMETEDLTSLLNNYLEEMSQIALKYGATIDKYIGDAIMIFFGDPESMGEKEDAIACVEMAIEMRERIRELQKTWIDRGIAEPFHIRMGINTGFCTVGNFGSNERMEYTIIGSQVNLASRLESAAEPDQILISQETFANIKDKIYCEKKEIISAKGIHYDVQTYQVIDRIEKIDKNTSHIEEHFEGFSITADLNLISKEEKRQIMKKLKMTFDRIKES